MLTGNKREDVGGQPGQNHEQCGAFALSNNTTLTTPPASITGVCDAEGYDVYLQENVEQKGPRKQDLANLASQTSCENTSDTLLPTAPMIANGTASPGLDAEEQSVSAENNLNESRGKASEHVDEASRSQERCSSGLSINAVATGAMPEDYALESNHKTAIRWNRGRPDGQDVTSQDDKKSLEARPIALERMKLGSDANWADEREILDTILQRHDDKNETALECSIRFAAGRIRWRGEVAQVPTDHALGITVVDSHYRANGDENGHDEYSSIAQIEIYSDGLQSLLRETVDFYPTANLYQTPLIIGRPFDVLFHHCERLVQTALTRSLSVKDKAGVRALEYMYSKKFKVFSMAKTCFANGKTTQYFLRYLYRPGMLLYTTDTLENPQIVVCVRHDVEEAKNSQFEICQLSVVRGWCMSWNWQFQRFERQFVAIATNQFEGDKDIKSLPVYPLRYYGTSEEVDRLKKDLVQRNRIWAKLVSQKPSCWLYKGTSFKFKDVDGRWELDQADSRVITDGKWRLSEVGNYTPILIVTDTMKAWDNRPKYQACDNIPSHTALTEKQLLLCVSMIGASDPESNKKIMISVQNLRPIIWNKTVFDQLVLAREKKDRLIRVLRDHLSEHSSASSDIIEGKGQGLVIVLYGPPGVGKTLTAECVAEHLERILIRLPIRDLVTNERVVEEISDTLDEAERHGAIVLLDEADVLLEKRSLEDVKRNGLVSSFLRTIEYFNGVIIMTTNRIATIDIAFQSRIHLAIEYTSTSVSTRRKIWTVFIERLADADAREDLLEHIEELKRFNLNGRQIRNAVKVAKGLAGGQRFTFAHLEQAVEEATVFSQHFEGESDATRSKLKVSLKGKRVPRYAPQIEDDDDDDDD